ncbi:MAG: dTDP-4-dehydrorhamnose reductase [Deltaproteobacteria bacterium GWC2_56_8]|nr:MAG: dTDP-4-dehydrorhamnose reductase [Deltaproteobacteria bacterium GWB2_55_19]OGP34794.1 MAG: dTDP-4-dehydrorhamnose reductase [Deltaproteobacteria bacterium GWC2_56_8]
MKVLVTGAKGQLALDLIPLLERSGHTVIGFDSSSLDITDPDRVGYEAARVKPGCIINTAAYTKVDLAEKERERAFAVNRDGARNLARAAASIGAPLIHVSTDFVFDGRKSTPYGEDELTGPLSVYGASKLAGEEEILQLLPAHFIIRTSWLYGMMGNNFVKTILRLATERDTIRVVYDQAGTPTWTRDLAGVIVTVVDAIEAGTLDYGIYNYSNEGVASWYDFAEAVVDESRRMGASLKCRTIEPILTSEYPTPAKRPAYSVLDKQKIKKAFGVTIPHWRASLIKMLEEADGAVIKAEEKQ